MGSEKKSKDKRKHNGKEKEQVVAARNGEDNIKHEKESRIITDARFSSVHSDPRFRKVPKKQSKVAIDSRFNRMFSDKGFSSSSAPTDKRGKPKKDTSESHLRHYYRLEEEEKQQQPKKEEESDEESDLGKVGQGNSSSESSGELESESGPPESSSDETGSDTSNSTSDTDEDDDVGDSSEEESIPVIEKETHRLALVNMDWSQLKAVDLFVLMSSYLPKGGQILSVAVYPSEFGLKRMEEESVRGPVGLFDGDKERSEDVEDDDEIDDEKLRAYEKAKLK